jgi:hypothetical protein
MNIGPIVRLVLDAAAAWNVRYGDDGGVAAVLRCGPRQPVGAADRFRHEPLHCAVQPHAESAHGVAMILVDGVRGRAKIGAAPPWAGASSAGETVHRRTATVKDFDTTLRGALVSLIPRFTYWQGSD